MRIARRDLGRIRHNNIDKTRRVGLPLTGNIGAHLAAKPRALHEIKVFARKSAAVFLRYQKRLRAEFYTDNAIPFGGSCQRYGDGATTRTEVKQMLHAFAASGYF
jgi:hypothetical protein